MQRPARLFCAISFTTTTGSRVRYFRWGPKAFFWGLHGGRQVDVQVENFKFCGTKSLATSCGAAVHGRPTNLEKQVTQKLPIGST